MAGEIGATEKTRTHRIRRGRGDYLMKNAAAKGSEQPLSLPFRLPDVEKCRFFLISV